MNDTMFEQTEYVDTIVQDIDDELEQRRVVMDDYDAGIVEGLRLARETIIKYRP